VIILLVVVQIIAAIIGGVLKIVHLNHFRLFYPRWISAIYWITTVFYFLAMFYMLTLLKTKEQTRVGVKIFLHILTAIILLAFWRISIFISVITVGPMAMAIIFIPLRTVILIVSYVILIIDTIVAFKQNKEKKINNQYWRNRK